MLPHGSCDRQSVTSTISIPCLVCVEMLSRQILASLYRFTVICLIPSATRADLLWSILGTMIDAQSCLMRVEEAISLCRHSFDPSFGAGPLITWTPFRHSLACFSLLEHTMPGHEGSQSQLLPVYWPFRAVDCSQQRHVLGLSLVIVNGKHE